MAAGGDLVMKVNLVFINRNDHRQEISRLFLGTALNSLQKAMILTPLDRERGQRVAQGLPGRRESGA